MECLSGGFQNMRYGEDSCVRVEANTFMFEVISFQNLLQSFGRPGLSLRIEKRIEISKRLVELGN
jgi:hypothetical protein